MAREKKTSRREGGAKEEKKGPFGDDPVGQVARQRLEEKQDKASEGQDDPDLTRAPPFPQQQVDACKGHDPRLDVSRQEV